MDKLLLGRYIPGDSWVHRLDPRTKLIASFYYIGIVFLANNWQTYLMMFVATLFMIWLSGIKIGFFLKGVRPLIVYGCAAGAIRSWWYSLLALGLVMDY